MRTPFTLFLLALLCFQANAQDWTATVAQQRRTVDFSLPGNAYKSTSDITIASFYKQTKPGTFMGGSLSYNSSVTDVASVSGRITSTAGTGSLFVLHSLKPNLLVDANVGYGNIALDNSYLSGATRITYAGKTDLLMAGTGITKVEPLSPTLTGSLTARYTQIKTMSKSHTDSAGVVTPEHARSFGFGTFGGGLSWRLGQWEPSARLNWNVANKEFDIGTNDRNYFSYSLGTGYALSTSTKLNLSYSGVAAKTYSKEGALMLSLRKAF